MYCYVLLCYVVMLCSVLFFCFAIEKDVLDTSTLDIRKNEEKLGSEKRNQLKRLERNKLQLEERKFL